MKKNPKSKISFFPVILLLFAGVLLSVNFIKATPSFAEGLTVAPAFISVSLTKKEPEKFESIGVKNEFSNAVTIEASVKGIDQQTGQLVPTDNISEPLKKSIEIVNPKIKLESGASANIQVKIKDNPALAPGGHYASIFIKQSSEPGAKVSLQPAISVALFIVKEEGAKRELVLTGINPKHSLFSLPRAVDLTFKNQGNVLVIPRAALLLTSQDNKTRYGSAVANEQSSPVLPSKELKLRVPITITKHPWLPGKYQISVQYRYDGAPSSSRAVDSFWYMPIGYLLPLALLFPGLYYQFKKHRKKASLRRVSKIVVRPTSRKKKPAKKKSRKA